MNNNEDTSRTSKRIATILFIACIVILTAILLLNRTLIENDTINKHNFDSFQTSSDNIGRLRAYHSLNADFFIGIISSEFKNLVFDENNPSLVKIGESYLERKIFYRTDGRIEEEQGHVDPTLYNEITSYSKRVSKIFAEYKEPEVRLQLINKALPDNFSNTALQRFIQDKVLPKIIRIDSGKEWEAVLSWILFPESPGLNKMAGVYGHIEGKISYANRFSKLWVEGKDKFHLYETLSHAKNYEDALAILISKWHESYEVLKRSPNALPTVSLQTLETLGFSAKIDDILMISGLLITFFQIIFFILWEKQNKDKSQNDPSTTFAFPYFSCQNDPLRKGRPNGLSGFFQRAIWAAFLILPSIIISIGILFRFDLFGLLANYNKPFRSINLSFLHVLLYYRSNDPLSVVLDFLNLVCLSISLLILINITKSNTDKKSITSNNKPRNRLQSYKMVIYYSPLVLLVFLFALKYFTVFSNKEGVFFSSIPTTVIFSVFGLLWMAIFCFSIQRQLRLLQALSSIVIMIVIVLLFL